MEQPEDKHGRLLEAALELFAEGGFDGVAVPRIAKSAGVATGTVYRHFASKEALVNALYQKWKAAYHAQVLSPLPRGLTVRDSFTTYWQRITDFARSNPRAIRFLELHHHAPYLDQASRAAGRPFGEAIENFVRETRKQGAVRTIEPELVVALIWGAAAGLIKFGAEDRLTFDASAAADMEEALWRAIVCD